MLMLCLLPHWPPIISLVGAIPGGQPVKPIYAAHAMLALSKVTFTSSLTSKGPLTTFAIPASAFLAALTPQACYEAMGLMQLLLELQ